MKRMFGGGISFFSSFGEQAKHKRSVEETKQNRKSLSIVKTVLKWD